jgi:hypothetical protein
MKRILIAVVLFFSMGLYAGQFKDFTSGFFELLVQGQYGTAQRFIDWNKFLFCSYDIWDEATKCETKQEVENLMQNF